MVSAIHVELTHRCQAECPMCVRTGNDKVGTAELTVYEFMKILPPDELKRVNHIYFCGNYGDPLACQDILEILRYTRTQNFNMKIGVITNGGLGNTETWKSISNLTDYVTFSVDGDKDTNHLYRRKVQWDKIERNIKTFIKRGGNANVDFIVFKHNEHQIDQVKTMMLDWGVSNFNVKKSYRAHKDGIEQTTISKYQNNKGHINVIQDREHLLRNAVIEPKCKKEDMIYISATGHVWPCCWIEIDLYKKNFDIECNDIKILVNLYGLESVNGKKNSIKTIKNSKIFEKIEESWSKNRLNVCSKRCSAFLDGYTHQYGTERSVDSG